MEEYKILIDYMIVNDPRPKLPKPNKCSKCNLDTNNLLWCGKRNNKTKYHKFTWKCKICFLNYNIM